MKINDTYTGATQNILRWVWDTLAEISDEVGTEENGEYLLAYEGWGEFCFCNMHNLKKSQVDNENIFFKYAQEKSYLIINEWAEARKNTHSLIDSGYEPTGLYGVTWALFKKLKSLKYANDV